MAKSYYIPSSDPGKAAWLKTFALKFSSYATLLGFTAADATAVSNDAVMFSYILDIIEFYSSETSERVNYKDILRDGPIGAALGPVPTTPTPPVAPTVVTAGIIPRVSGIVRRIKGHPAYTEAIGKDLGIIGAEQVATFDVAKPIVKLSKAGGNVVFKYKKGKAAGLRIMSRRSNETEMTLLATVTKPQYKDTRPNLVTGQAETRYYCCWFLKDDDIIGQCSDESSIVV